MAMSFEDLQTALAQALLDSFGTDVNGCPLFTLQETFPDYVIARSPDNDLYQIPYAVGASTDDSIAFGEPQEVETAYIPVAEAVRFRAANGDPQPSDDGWTWPIQVMEAGWAHGQIDDVDGQLAQLPHYFPVEVVTQVAAACKSARFGRRHPVAAGEETDPARIAGIITEGRMEGNRALATLHLNETETQIRAQLLAAKKAGKLDLYGASILGLFALAKGTADGKPALVAQRLARLISVDFVTEAGAGGKILPYAVSRTMQAEIAQQQRGAIKARQNKTLYQPKHNGSAQRAGRIQGGFPSMKESIVKVLEALRSINAGRAAELETEFISLPEDQQNEFFARVSLAVTTELPTVLSTVALAGPAAAVFSETHNSSVLAQAREALENARRIRFGNTLDLKLRASRLPAPAQALVRQHFQSSDGMLQVADDSAVDAFIARTRQAFASAADVGRVSAIGVEVGLETVDKVQLAMDAMMGVKDKGQELFSVQEGKPVLKGKVKPFRGIREAYSICTGDPDCSFGKHGTGFFKVSEAIATTDFPNILLNSMTKKLLQDYDEYQIVPNLEKMFVATTLGDYKTQDRVRLGYVGDLPTVAEAAVYTELTKPTDEKISYTISKRGGLLTISEETIRNDDLSKIAQFPGRLARAARHTLATFVTNFFITPPNYDPDGLAWFHATHNNLGATALSSGELDQRAILLAKQTEKDSGNRLGLTLDWIMIPIDLRLTAMQINRNMTGTNNWYGKFGDNEENVIVNPLLTDVTDWYYGTYSAPFLEIGFLDGYQTPQIFIANVPNQGTQFTNDQLQYKVKFVFGGKPIDFRGVGKEVVAG
ncbi:MAG TPA: hypothetical protein VF532_05910 [Candidatus Angelobacter sp.]